ncbi:alpha/beta hydrolase [Tenacibaculum sp. Mcav3-52]|uniref:alpha/beta hydrolase family protein n=1 Tax=Tenacibaculum TaxID=104267 RepID=UPI0012E67091|nr:MULTISPECIES: alpha/beta fold hydrolase [Tenacibaculum]KAF9659831.1 alpha/beta hydrolase [Tenacibaculum mesophilum]MCG7501912.1 alpha/beta hydrolase [Tenacibaculum sp. Mcav3-52]BFF38688.1 alpha/beta fold hydrolase [Tenacibaculum mesophilum]GFD81196.1 alpha/beta hydrolase [Tenacibaculum sp. KUL118]
MKQIEILSNCEVLSATLYEDEKNETVLIIASATGVKQEYYQNFSKYLSENGISVLTFDYCGIGRSLRKPILELSNNAADWGKNDIESVLQYVLKNYPNSKKVILGHSIGGQLIGLAKSSPKFDKIILLAAQSGYWRFWEGINKFKMWFNWYILFPSILNLFGYLKSKKLSGMENLPKNVANQWKNWGKKSDYMQGDKSIVLKYYDKIKFDISAFCIEDDDFAPQKAVEWMTSQYQNSNIKSTILKPSDFGVEKIGHFGVFKNKFKATIWKTLLNEIK